MISNGNALQSQEVSRVNWMEAAMPENSSRFPFLISSALYTLPGLTGGSNAALVVSAAFPASSFQKHSRRSVDTAGNEDNV